MLNFQGWARCKRFERVRGDVIRIRGNVDPASLQLGLQGISVGYGPKTKLLNSWSTLPVIEIGREFDYVLRGIKANKLEGAGAHRLIFLLICPAFGNDPNGDQI